MTWQELLQTNHETVIVQSYGYTERSYAFESHFEPFKHKRDFIFNINRVQFEGEELLGFLEHKWLFLEDPEEELTFEEKDGKIILDDPDLWARP